MSITLSPSRRHIAACAANARTAAAGRPGQPIQPLAPFDFDEDGYFARKLYLPNQVIPVEDSQIPFFDVSRNPAHMIDDDLELYPEDEALAQTSPDWQVRWELRGKLWLCDEQGFRLSNNPLAPFEMLDTIILCPELATRTDTVREEWEKAVVHFPLIPPHQLLPVDSTRMIVNIGCPYPGCHHIIQETGHVEDHLATAHFFDDPQRTWVAMDPLSDIGKNIECSCVYDRKTGVELENAPCEMNRKEFLDHVVQEHFYGEAVHCRFCGIPVIGVDMYPRHITDECQVLKPWYGATEIPVGVKRMIDAVGGEDVVMDDELPSQSPSKKRPRLLGPSRKSARLTKKVDYTEPDSDNDEPMGGISTMEDSPAEHVERSPAQVHEDDESMDSVSTMEDSPDEHIECSSAQVPVTTSLDTSDAMSDLTACSDNEDEKMPAVEATPTRRSSRFLNKPRKTWSRRDFCN